jgi:hypothetical protein
MNWMCDIYLFSFAAAILLLACATNVAMAQSRKPVSTTLCEIGGQPKQFDGKFVMFKARISKPWLEGATLFDENCDAIGVAPYLPKNVKGGVALDNALRRDHPGTMDKDVSAIWIGTFRWQPKRVPNRILNVVEIKDVVAFP